MIKFDQFKEMALAFDGAMEAPHFEKSSFRIKKKIFATFDHQKERACLKLSMADQDIFSLIDATVIYPVPNKWGKQGWTFVEISRIDQVVLNDLLKTAFTEVSRKK